MSESPRRWRIWNVDYGQSHVEGRQVGRYAYVHLGCRCDGCREANRAYQHIANAARAAKPRDESGHPIGIPVAASTYKNWGCRCVPCRAAHRDAMRLGGAQQRWAERQRAAS